MPLMEFHISRQARDRYGVGAALFSLSGNVIFADVAASRDLAHTVNRVRGAEQDPKRAMNPGALFAMGLIDEASHMLIAFYRRKLAPEVIRGALGWFEARIGQAALGRVLATFVEEFPGSEVYTKGLPAAQWISGHTDGISHREIAFEELILLWLANANRAFLPFREFFDDRKLLQTTEFGKVISGLREYFATQPPLAQQNLVDVLRAPALASPDSLSGQLAYIREKWAEFIDVDVLRRLLLAADVLQEEEVAIWMRFHPPSEEEEARKRGGRWGFQAGFEGVPDYTTALNEYERFSADTDWMPNTVMIAKSTYVWLHQLSRWYQRDIRRLDQIPDQELDLLRQRGINALWLIGLWERSRASRTIKRLCGKEDAVASAYSLYDYRIADDLGGDEAYRNLRDRAWYRGIRLASDMVPNHMGIDSPWVIEHPEWFLSRPDSPYPAYSFEGPDLSGDGRVEIKIEDHYYNQTDAAVVFRRRDKWTGDTRFVYHGNDGTSFPWNDTAQLDYLSAAVREQVIQVILSVARKFPIIRFDAAMTLAKRHIQRLWFPAPGQGGAIPSRAEYAMPTSEFDRLIPVEFWREVVDRVAAEAPDTLLLAEAFWLMEGYFVRTLGMHRVYNSAFMVLLRDEENAHYRSVLKNTLEFDPGIMKRYVNFMSNPDERTAIDQFGTGDKYFGVATMMATLPGLPMFGHGQIEGFAEKYGMEYYRPRQDEDPNQWLVERHQREIAPLLHNRSLFAESENFLLYDFWREDGAVDENVFAYSNRRGNQRAIVIYQNKWASTRGTIHHSAAYMDKGAGVLRQRTLAEGLALPRDPSLFLGYRDVSTGLEYLRRSSELVENGFTIHLDAYKYHVLLHWRELRPSAEHPWDRLHDQLRGAGVPSLDEALDNLQLEPVHSALAAYLDPALVLRFAEKASRPANTADSALNSLLGELAGHGATFHAESRTIWLKRNGGADQRAPVSREKRVASLRSALRSAMPLSAVGADGAKGWSPEAAAVLPLGDLHQTSASKWGPVLAWILVKHLAEALGEPPTSLPVAFDKLLLRPALAHAFAPLGLAGEEGWRGAARVRVLLARLASGHQHTSELSAADWQEGDVRWLAGVHEADGQRYIVKEALEKLLWWLALPRLIGLEEPQSRVRGSAGLEASQRNRPAAEVAQIAAQVRSTLTEVEECGFDFDRLLEQRSEADAETDQLATVRASAAAVGQRAKSAKKAAPVSSSARPGSRPVAPKKAARPAPPSTPTPAKAAPARSGPAKKAPAKGAAGKPETQPAVSPKPGSRSTVPKSSPTNPAPAAKTAAKKGAGQVPGRRDGSGPKSS
jgi:glycosidase